MPRHLWALACVIVLTGCASQPDGVAQTGPVIENSIGMKLVAIPAGEFQMGSVESPETLAKAYPGYDKERFTQLADEGPVHTVRITRPFYMGQHEVTVGQFKRFLAASGYTPESIADKTGGYGYNPDYVAQRSAKQDAFEGRDPKYSWQNPGFAQGDHDPVVNVTWHDAQALAQWLSQTEHRTYRLPTEAEWEYACRAGSRTRYQGGDDPASLKDTANVFDASAKNNWPDWAPFALLSSDGHPFTAPVGQFAPNAFGLHDMHGNVWEWTADWHDDHYYAHAPVNDPQGPETGSVRVRRGGSWHTWSFYARCSYRNWNAPTTRYTLVGIRLVMQDK